MTTANRSLVSSSSSHVKQNQLLSASKQGKVEEVRRLLKLGESVTQRDYKGNTPLHCASKRGHYAVVQLLLQDGAPVDLLNDSDKSPIELSTQPGITKLLALAVQKKEASSLLLPKKQILRESTKSSSSFSYPFHVAAKEGNSKELLRLLELGKKIDERDGQGNTPLHLASMHGRLSTVELLVEKGASVQVRNASKETPLDLAKTWGQSEVVNFLVKKHEQSVSSSSKVTLIQNNNVSTTATSKDLEGQAYLQFEAAYEAGKAMDQVLSLEKLAELRLEKKDYFGAAHLINGAIAVATRSRVEQSCTKSLYQKLMEIEQLFLRKELGFKAAKRSHPTYARNELKKIREGAARRLQQNKPIQEVQVFLTKGYKVLLCELIGECMDLLGKGRPKAFAVMGLGSMARDEMCPYSDVEFAFIVKDPTQQNLAYFRCLSQLLTLKMINIGETKHKLIRPKRVNQVMQPAKSLTPTGFSMDIGGLCPEGKKGIYELIGSPEHLANFQTPEWLQQNESEIILANAMTTVCHVMGDRLLVVDYKKRIESTLGKKDGFLSLIGRRLRERRAIELILGYISEFKPRLDQNKVDLCGFDAKKELYRPIQSIIGAVALYYGLNARDTCACIEKLEKLDVFTSDGANHLRNAFRIAVRLRFECHLFYKREKEIVYLAENRQSKGAKGLFCISLSTVEEIRTVYCTLVPFFRAAVRFAKGEEGALRNPLWDANLGEYNDRDRDSFSFSIAYFLAQSQAAFNPRGYEALWNLANVQLSLGKSEHALQNFEKAFSLVANGKLGVSAPEELPGLLENLGHAQSKQKNKQEALRYYLMALQVRQVMYKGNDNIHIAQTLLHVAQANADLSRYSEAVSLFTRSLAIRRRVAAGSERVASGLSGLAGVYLEMQEYEKAEPLFQEALQIRQHLHSGKHHATVARSYYELAMLYQSMGRNRQAVKFLEESLAEYKESYDNQPHPDIATVLCELGTVSDRIGTSLDISIGYHRASLKMLELLQEDKTLPRFSNNWNALGILYRKKRSYKESILNYRSALNCFINIYGNRDHAQYAMTLHNLANVYVESGEKKKAIEYYKKALGMKTRLWGKAHPSTRNTISALVRQLIDYDVEDIVSLLGGKDLKAFDCLKASPEIKPAIFGREKVNLSVLTSSNSLGSAYRALGDASKAIEPLEQSLKETRPFYGSKPHPSVAIRLNNLGRACRARGDVSKAIEYYKQSLKVKRQLYGSEPHPSVAISLNNLGEAYQALNNASKAIEYYEASLKIKRQIYERKPHSSVAVSLNNLGSAYRALGDTSKAIEYYEASLKMKRQLYGSKLCPDVATSLNNLGEAYLALNNASKAIEYYEASLKMKYQIYGNKSHLSVATSLVGIGRAYYVLGNILKEIEYYQLAYDIRIQVLGAQHSDTKSVEKYLAEALVRQRKKHSQSSSSSSK